MKTHIWNRTEPFPGKVNFIDSNNVVLGYDLEQSCCENAFWTISEQPDGSAPIHEGDSEDAQEIELEGYCFDPSYCQKLDNEAEEQYVATFKLVGLWDLPDLYVRLENHQNGYYGHGFTFRGAVVIEGVL